MRKRLQLTRERAFTLIELLVVILIVGILIAVAAPSFLGQTSKAQDSIAQQNLYNAYISGKSDAWVPTSSYPFIGDPTPNLGTTADIAGSFPGAQNSLFGYLNTGGTGLTFSWDVSATDPNQIKVGEPAPAPGAQPQVIFYADQSGSGTIFCLEDVEQPQTVGSVVWTAGVYHAEGANCSSAGDVAAPTVTITSAPAPASALTSGTVTYTESGTVSSTACTLDGVSAACSATSASLSGLSSGAHVFTVVDTGPAGSASATANFTVTGGSPPAAPTVVITSSPPPDSSSTLGTVVYDETGGGTVTSTACTLDGVSTACSSTSASLSSLALGLHVFTVVASGPGGSASATATFAIDTAPSPACTVGCSTGSPPTAVPTTSSKVPIPESFIGTGTAPSITDVVANDSFDETQPSCANPDDCISADINNYNSGGPYSFQVSTSPDFPSSGANVAHTFTSTYHVASASNGTLISHNGYLDYYAEFTDVNTAQSWGYTAGQTIYWRVTASTNGGFGTTSKSNSFVMPASTGGSGGSGGTGGTGSGGTGGSFTPGAGAAVLTENPSSFGPDGYGQVFGAHPDGTGLGSLVSGLMYDANDTIGWQMTANDQSGNVYVATPYFATAGINISANGSSQVALDSSACPDDPDSGGNYYIAAMAFTPNGSKGAWLCSDWYGGQGGYVMYWNGSSATDIHNSAGVFTNNSAIAISPDGSRVAYLATDQTVSAYSADGGSERSGGNVPVSLYSLSTSGGSPTVLASESNPNSGSGPWLGAGNNGNFGTTAGFVNTGGYSLDSPNGGLAFVDGGTNVIYNEYSDSGTYDNTVYKVAAAGGTPSPLLSSSGGLTWQVLGAADAAGNQFLCQQFDTTSGGLQQDALCNSDGSVATVLTVPADSRGDLVGYSAAGNGFTGPGGAAGGAARIPTVGGRPSLSGSFIEGDTLTTSNGVWANTPTSYAYLWMRCTASTPGDANSGDISSCTTISGATSSTYTLTSADVGDYIRSQVVASNSAGSSAPELMYTPGGPVAGAPTITGSTVVGAEMTADAGPWSPTPNDYYFQWQYCNAAGDPSSCADIGSGYGDLSSGGSSTNNRYTVSGDVGNTLRVAVKTSTNNGSTWTAFEYSAPTAVITVPPAPSNTTAPAVSGSAVVGSELTTDSGTWSPTPDTYNYQWQDCNSSGSSCTDISGATSWYYYVQDGGPGTGDVGSTIRVGVSVSNTGGATSAVVYSGVTAVVPVFVSCSGATGSGGGTTTSMSVLLDFGSNAACVANTDGAGLTDVAGSWNQFANDQAGNVYVVDNTGQNISKSTDGATPNPSFMPNACTPSNPSGDNPDGVGAGNYVVAGLAFTPTGNKGAWLCVDNFGYGTYNGSNWNGFIVYWDGSSTRVIYQGLGVMTPSTSGLHSMMITPDGSKVVVAGMNELQSDWVAQNGPVSSLYEVSTSGAYNQTATTLDSGTEYNGGTNNNDIGTYGVTVGNQLGLINGGMDVVYNVTTNGGSTNSIYQVPLAGGSPSVLVSPDGSSNSWEVKGQANAGGSAFACQQNDSSFNVLQTGVCDSSGALTSSVTMPSTTDGVDFAGYSAAGGSGL